MGYLNSIYKILEIPKEKFVFNNPVTGANQGVTKEFNIVADGYDLEGVRSVFWHFGDPFAVGSNEKIQYALEPVSHFYPRNGIYDVHAIINAETYTVHLKTKANVYDGSQPFLTTEVISGADIYVTIKSYDPQALIYYSLYTSAGDINWTQYQDTFIVPLDTPYYLYKAVLSTGEITYAYVEPLKSISAKMLEVFDPIYTGTEITSYTSGGTTAYATSAVTATIASPTSADYYTHRAVKISFRIGDIELANSTVFAIRYWLKNKDGGTVTNPPDIGNPPFHTYTGPFIIPDTDTLYWQVIPKASIYSINDTLKIFNYTIDVGIDSDIESLNLNV